MTDDIWKHNVRNPNKDGKEEYVLGFIVKNSRVTDNLENVIEMKIPKIYGGICNYIKSEFVLCFAGGCSGNELRGRKNIIDMNSVEDIDSSGISTILTFNNLNNKSDYEPLEVINCNYQVWKNLISSQIDDIITVKPKENYSMPSKDIDYMLDIMLKR